jgi:gamma-glutamylcyclotransferase
MKIFSYGSNMNLNRLLERVPSAVKLTNAVIYNYALVCNKVSTDGSAKANIMNTGNPEHRVWGVIYEIDDSEKAKLDQFEGLGYGYTEAELSFTDVQGVVHQAHVYIAEESAMNNERLAFDWYKAFIVTGAQQNQLPADYIAELTALPCIVDKDEARQQRNLKILLGEQ